MFCQMKSISQITMNKYESCDPRFYFIHLDNVEDALLARLSHYFVSMTGRAYQFCGIIIVTFFFKITNSQSEFGLKLYSNFSVICYIE